MKSSVWLTVGPKRVWNQLYQTVQMESLQKKQTLMFLREAFAHGTLYGKDLWRWKEIIAAIAKYMCKDVASIYMVKIQGICEWQNQPKIHNTKPQLKVKWNVPFHVDISKKIYLLIYRKCMIFGYEGTYIKKHHTALKDVRAKSLMCEVLGGRRITCTLTITSKIIDSTKLQPIERKVEAGR